MIKKHINSVQQFTKKLNKYGLSRQQLKTLKGQALAGDLAGAIKGLEKIIGRAG